MRLGLTSKLTKWNQEDSLKGKGLHGVYSGIIRSRARLDQTKVYPFI